MELNIDKCSCRRIGPRYDRDCSAIHSICGSVIAPVTELRYLGVHICSSRKFKCSFHSAKAKFNKVANAVFSKLFGVASEELLLHLLKVKCIPVLLYGTEACDHTKACLHSLDFIVIKFGMKLFKSSNRNFVIDCLNYFDLQLPSRVIIARSAKFKDKFRYIDNTACQYIVCNC